MQSGDRVRITAGPHTGRAGLVVSTHDCVVAGPLVEVRLFNSCACERVVSIPAENVEAAPRRCVVNGFERKQVTLSDCLTSLLLLEGLDADAARRVGGRMADVAVEMLTSPTDRQRALLEWLDRCADEASVADGGLSDA